ncbi:HK97 gp10 family phage protein [Ligilactobacillus sp. WILCCON 0076]|uniref:HK97 gp10 family phage protein n=1 Tax=Ligilactobacillus ubinensis TaxID=2876789 RepID=A0A9X2JLC6_9LACO|nr:HK97-gp10 family putative phage morphogenesis protein [Ligilactobacillus ubinensis]MCP0885916.1 HK97 gp10 family phage protein [Ligilactobacillus ubinensis]
MSGASFDVKFDGLEKLYSQFSTNKAQARTATATAMKATIAKAQQTSQSIVPVDTGYLRQNIVVKPVETNGDTVLGEYVASKADYASYVEYGTYKMAAQPYIRPAIAAVKPYFYSQVKLALQKVGND